MPTATGHTIAIGANRVLGTSVLDSEDQKVGNVEEIVLDKTSNRIMFAVVSLGGAVTVGNNFRALPWATLDYDEEKGAYKLQCPLEEVAKGPAHSAVEELIANDAAEARDAAYEHFKINKDW